MKKLVTGILVWGTFKAVNAIKSTSEFLIKTVAIVSWKAIAFFSRK